MAKLFPRLSPYIPLVRKAGEKPQLNTGKPLSNFEKNFSILSLNYKPTKAGDLTSPVGFLNSCIFSKEIHSVDLSIQVVYS